MLKLKRKYVYPTVYAIEITAAGCDLLYLTVAYSLEKAIVLAKEFAEQKTSINAHEWTLDKYTYTAVDKLTKDVTEEISISTSQHEQEQKITVTDTTTPPSFKNKLIATILKTQNAKLLQDSLQFLTEHEIEYIYTALLKHNKK